MKNILIAFSALFSVSLLAAEPQIVWDDVTMQDEVELARARLYDAQAKQLLRKLDKEATA